MGWSGGQEILERVAYALDEEFPVSYETKKKNILASLIRQLEYDDADTLGDCFECTPALDEALKQEGYEILD